MNKAMGRLAVVRSMQSYIMSHKGIVRKIQHAKCHVLTRIARNFFIKQRPARHSGYVPTVWAKL